MTEPLYHGPPNAMLSVKTKALFWTKNTFLVVEWYRINGILFPPIINSFNNGLVTFPEPQFYHL